MGGLEGVELTIRALAHHLIHPFPLAAAPRFNFPITVAEDTKRGKHQALGYFPNWLQLWQSCYNSINAATERHCFSFVQMSDVPKCLGSSLFVHFYQLMLMALLSKGLQRH